MSYIERVSTIDFFIQSESSATTIISSNDYPNLFAKGIKRADMPFPFGRRGFSEYPLRSTGYGYLGTKQRVAFQIDARNGGPVSISSFLFASTSKPYVDLTRAELELTSVASQLRKRISFTPFWGVAMIR